MLDIKDQFPFFAANPNIVYLDSAATTQKPKIIIDALAEFYTKQNSNAGRSTYPLANRLAKEIEVARGKVCDFIHAASANEIVFTAGATDSFNKIAYSLAYNYLKDGDEVLYCPHDHQSFVLPWIKVQQVLKRSGVTITLTPFSVRTTGGADIDDILSKVSSKTKIINITHIHNRFGSDSDIGPLREQLGERNIILNVDATQSVGHIDVDVQRLGADILSFSGHKMFADQGAGVLYVRKGLQEHLPPVFVGGGDGVELCDGNIKIKSFVHAHEAGTQNAPGILSLGTAIDYINTLGIKNIHTHLAELTQYLLHQLRQIPEVVFAPGPHYWNCEDGFGTLSFTLKDIPSNEVGFILAENNIFVRTGAHCSTSKALADDTVRVSVHAYNTKNEIDLLVKNIKAIAGNV